jgi:hypothetical protein
MVQPIIKIVNTDKIVNAKLKNIVLLYKKLFLPLYAIKGLMESENIVKAYTA